jgi:hypothetical protein
MAYFGGSTAIASISNSALACELQRFGSPYRPAARSVHEFIRTSRKSAGATYQRRIRDLDHVLETAITAASATFRSRSTASPRAEIAELSGRLPSGVMPAQPAMYTVAGLVVSTT